MKRSTLLSLIRFLMKSLTELQFSGLENIPTQGGVIIATNHLSRIDIPLLFINPRRPDITALVADKYQDYPLFRWFTESAGGIWLDRSKADFTAFRVAADILKQGRALGISPEGTRSETGQLLEGKSGTALLAIRTGVPIVPVGLAGTETAVSKLKRLQRPHLQAVFGPAFHLPPLNRENREAELQAATEEVMLRIAAVLPEKYRGFYADHPRLKQFLAEQG